MREMVRGSSLLLLLGPDFVPSLILVYEKRESIGWKQWLSAWLCLVQQPALNHFPLSVRSLFPMEVLNMVSLKEQRERASRFSS